MDSIEMIPLGSGARAPSMPGQFPSFFDVPAVQRSRSRMSPPSDTESTFSNYPPSVVAHPPPRGILKNSSNRQEQERLAARFYRIPKPVQTYHTAPHSPIPSPTYYGSDSSYLGYDGETDITSSSSELSVNTQATSVASSDFTDTKSYRRTVHVRHVRPVPLPITRVKARRPRTRAPSEVSRSDGSKSRSQSSGKRTVHIQIIPNKAALPAPESMQLARYQNGELVHRLEQLETDKDDLQLVRRQLTRQLGDASQELSLRVHENNEIVRALRQERDNKELILRDLEEQRKLFDGFRNDYEWQKSMLQEVERERDRLRQANNHAEQKLLTLERDMSDLERDTSERQQRQREQDGALQVHINQLEMATTTLENKVLTGDERLKEIAVERDDLRAQTSYYQEQIKIWKKLKTPSQREKRVVEEARQKLQAELDVSTAEKEALQAKITGLEANISTLESQIKEFETTIKTLETTLASEKVSKDDLQKKLSMDKEELEKQLIAEKDELQKQLVAGKEALAQQLEAAKGDFEKQLQTTKDGLGKQLDDVKNELGQQLEHRKAELEKQVENHKVEKEGLQKQIEAGDMARGELEKKLETAKAELGNEIAAKDDVEKRVAAWLAEKDAKQSMIDGLIIDLDGAKDANISLVTERLSAEKKLAEVEANLVTVQGELTGLQATHETLQSDNEKLQAQATDLTQKAADLDKLQMAKTTEIGMLWTERAELDKKAKSLQADLDAAEAARATLQGEKDQLEAHTKEFENGSPLIAKLKEEKASLEAQVSSLQASADKADELMQAKVDLEARINRLQGEADRVPMLEGTIAMIQGQASLVPGLRDQIERLNMQIADLNTRLNSSPSRSNSRAPHKRHGRSPSNGFVFVRNSAEKGGHVFITTREALSKDRDRD